MIAAYPLAWPEGWPRNGRRKDAKFGKGERQYDAEGQPTWMAKRDITMADAIKRVRYELERLGVKNAADDAVISTNLKLSISGNPRGDQGEPSDPGVAVYWQLPGKPMKVMAIDRYRRVRDNLAAVAATLEAMRAIERHGGGQILDRAFTGFTALPPPKSCWEILGFKGPVDPDAVNARFRELAGQHHPDRGGSHARMAELSAARDQALQSIP